MLRPGSLLSRTLAVVLLIAVVMIGYRLVVAPVLAAYRDVAQTIDQQTTLLERYRRLAGQRAELVELVAEQEARASDVAGYLEAPSPAMAGAKLQDRVKGVIEVAGGTLRSMQILKARTGAEGTPRERATLKIRFSSDIDGLAAVLYELETGEPFLFVEELVVRELRQRRRRRNEPEPKPMLDVSLDVFAYVREPEA